MKQPLYRFGLCCVLLTLGVTACSSNPSRTHRGDLLDEKVAAQRVQAELAGAGPAFKDVQVRTSNGTLILTGSVRSPGQRARAEDLAKSVHRSVKLEDQLQVHP